MNKVRATTKFLTRDMLHYLWLTYAWVAGFVIVLPLFFSILSGQFSWESIAGDLASMPISLVSFFFVFFFSALTYENFKILIQNGISRQTYWRAKANLVVITAVIVTVINLLYLALIQIPFGHTKIATSSLYMLAFGQAVQPTWLSFLVSIVFNLLMTITWGLFAQALGSIFSLMDKRLRRILYLILPILAIMLVFFITAGLVYIKAVWIIKVIAFMLGADAKFNYFTPWVPMIEMVIFSAIMLWVSLFFNRKLGLRRD